VKKQAVHRHARAATLVEAALSTVLVGVTIVAALNAAGAAVTGRRISEDRLRGRALADALLTEIERTLYADPERLHELREEILNKNGDISGDIGLEGSEGDDGTRSAFDDVDDYDGWEASPPQRADGTPMAGLEGWTRRVRVEHARPNNPRNASSADQGVKRVEVTVLRQGRVAATATAVRTVRPPVREACCFDDLPEMDLLKDTCGDLGGSALGKHTTAAANDCDPP